MPSFMNTFVMKKKDFPSFTSMWKSNWYSHLLEGSSKEKTGLLV